MKLTKNEIEQKVSELSGWVLAEDKLLLKLELKDFLEACGTLIEIGELAEEVNHHPDFNLHSYNKLDITLFTHDVGGLTQKDFDLATSISLIIKK